MQFKLSSSLLALLATSFVSAQTHTECDPTKKDCPPDPALGKKVTVDFRQGESDVFKVAQGTSLKYDKDKGAIFSIKGDGDAPTIFTPTYIFFGRVEVECKVAPGVGIVSSIVLQSDTLDEIDWEWLGGDNYHVQTNYFSKGDTTTYDRGAMHDLANAVSEVHTYVIDWDEKRIQWIIDGNVVRTLTYEDAKNGAIYPQTPMQVKLGTWVAGRKDAPQGTVEWAGGYADYSEGPFEAYYKHVTITDYKGGKDKAGSYVYGDRSGTWKSIKVRSEGAPVDESDDKTPTIKTTTRSVTSSDNQSTETSSSDDKTSSGDKDGQNTTLSTVTASPTDNDASPTDEVSGESNDDGSDASNSSFRPSVAITTAALCASAAFINIVI